MTQTLLDQQTGAIAFQVGPLTDALRTDTVTRHNQYTVVLLQSGTLPMTIDFATHNLSAKSLVCLSPYQPYQLKTLSNAQGWILYFHSDFFCTYKHQHEIALEGALFHNNYELPYFGIQDDTLLDITLRQMQAELNRPGLAQHELLVAYLKIYLIHALRLKTECDKSIVPANCLPTAIVSLKESLERNYRHLHRPADYARLVHLAPRTVGKLVKKHFNKSLSDLIAQRIIIEAKRELYLTAKSVKEIAHWLGYADEYYFSRFFKRHAGISPQRYRHTVGFARAEEN